MTRPALKPEPLPPSHLERAEAMGLRTVSYLNTFVPTDMGRNEWLPRDIVGRDGKTLIVHRLADSDYRFDGWCPEHDGMFGGRYTTIHGALNWVQCAIDVRAGRRDDFRGC